jgi:hypothetical protein
LVAFCDVQETSIPFSLFGTQKSGRWRAACNPTANRRLQTLMQSMRFTREPGCRTDYWNFLVGPRVELRVCGGRKRAVRIGTSRPHTRPRRWTPILAAGCAGRGAKPLPDGVALERCIYSATGCCIDGFAFMHDSPAASRLQLFLARLANTSLRYEPASSNSANNPAQIPVNPHSPHGGLGQGDSPVRRGRPTSVAPSIAFSVTPLQPPAKRLIQCRLALHITTSANHGRKGGTGKGGDEATDGQGKGAIDSRFLGWVGRSFAHGELLGCTSRDA